MRTTIRRRGLLALLASSVLAVGCAGPWEVAYDTGLSPEVTRSWRLSGVDVTVPESLSVSEANVLVPDADIVWHGERLGDRRAQIARIIREGLTQGARDLPGRRPVTIAARVQEFHGVTPAAISLAPSAVHNIRYAVQVFDARTGAALTEPQTISAALEANTGAAAVVAALEGQTERVRIVDHLAIVTRGWLGLGPDERRTFVTLGR